jgi:hypothetical protein
MLRIIINTIALVLFCCAGAWSGLGLICCGCYTDGLFGNVLISIGVFYYVIVAIYMDFINESKRSDSVTAR